MTKSNRRSSNTWSKQRVDVTNHICEECDGNLIHLHQNKYICSKCGLEQTRE